MKKTIVLTALIVAIAAAAPAHLPRVPSGRVLTISPIGFGSEPALAIDERDPRHAVAAFQVGAHVANTTDGGRTWHTHNLAPRNYAVSGDVSLAYARGRAYLCYIAFDRLGSDQYWAHGATRNAIDIRRSLDGGAHWESRAIPVIAHEGHPNLFEDKPIVVADDTGSPYAGNLYVGWTQFRIADAQIVFSRSTDGGSTWSKPLRISTNNGTPRDDNGTVEGFDGTVDADGTLDVVWQDGSHLIFTRSRDGGKTFEASRPIIDIPAANFPLSGFDGRTANGFPQIDIDRKNHRLYVAWSDTRDGGADVFVASSTDGGTTWSAPVRVNNDELHNGADHFYQWMAVDRATGDVYLDFNDRRGDPRNLVATITLARSTDGGATFTNYAWTTRPWNPRHQFVGDYSALAAYAGRVYGAWTETVPPTDTKTLRGLSKPRTFIRLGEAQF